MLRSLVMTMVLILPASLVHAQLVPLPPQPADVPWPTREWPAGQLPEGLDTNAFHALVDDAFEKQAEGLGEMRELVIIRGGRLIFERAAVGYNTSMPLVSWSMAKSVTQALVGVAAAQ